MWRNQEVAIKVLKNAPDVEELMEFKKEFDIISSIRSPFIVYFYGMVLRPKVGKTRNSGKGRSKPKLGERGIKLEFACRRSREPRGITGLTKIRHPIGKKVANARETRMGRMIVVAEIEPCPESGLEITWTRTRPTISSSIAADIRMVPRRLVLRPVVFRRLKAVPRLVEQSDGRDDGGEVGSTF